MVERGGWRVNVRGLKEAAGVVKNFFKTGTLGIERSGGLTPELESQERGGLAPLGGGVEPDLDAGKGHEGQAGRVGKARLGRGPRQVQAMGPAYQQRKGAITIVGDDQIVKAAAGAEFEGRHRVEATGGDGAGDRIRAEEVGDQRQVVSPGIDRDQVGLAVEAAHEEQPGIVADREGLGILVVEEPAADAREQGDVVRPAVADQDVLIGAAGGEVADDRGDRACPAGIQPRPRIE